MGVGEKLNKRSSQGAHFYHLNQQSVLLDQSSIPCAEREFASLRPLTSSRGRARAVDSGTWNIWRTLQLAQAPVIYETQKSIQVTADASSSVESLPFLIHVFRRIIKLTSPPSRQETLFDRVGTSDYVSGSLFMDLAANREASGNVTHCH